MLQKLAVYGLLALAALYLMRKWGLLKKKTGSKDCDCDSGCH